MKVKIERQKPKGSFDYLALAVATFGVGYLPYAPGTWGSMVGVAIYIGVASVVASLAASGAANAGALETLAVWAPQFAAWSHVVILVLFLLLCLLGVRSAGRAIKLLGNEDPPEAVVDEVIGQLITFLFVPFGVGWPMIVAGFLLFRLFDIWKPYPIDYLQALPGGIGVCADDILAGVYAGVCLAVIYAVSLSI